MPPDQYEDIELANWEVGSSSLGPPTQVQPSRQAWHPKLTPYRLLSVLLPVCLGTIKAVALQQGQEDEPITLEWISGVVVFIVLFTTGTYECRPIQHVSAYLAWLFKYDCMDAVWWLRFTISRGLLTRPRYISDEIEVEAHGTIYMVTSYRLLVCATVVSIGMLKAGLTYGGISTGATWVEWILGVLVSSALYIIGLYESNTIGLWPSFFGMDRAYITWNGLTGTLTLLLILGYSLLMSSWFMLEPLSKFPNWHTDTELPVILRAYNLLTIMMVYGFFIFLHLVGMVTVLWLSKTIREKLGVRVRVPLRIRVFGSWIASFASSAYVLLISSCNLSFMSTFARSLAGVLSLTYTLRHLLYFIVSSFLIVLAISSFAGQVYRYSTGDLFIIDEDGSKIFVGLWTVVLLGLVGTITIFRAVRPFVRSLREMFRSARNVYAVRIAPRIRRARGKAGEKAEQIKRRVQRRAGHAVLRLSGLSVVEDVHYAFLELVWMLRADAEVAHIRSQSDMARHYGHGNEHAPVLHPPNSSNQWFPRQNSRRLSKITRRYTSNNPNHT